MKYVIAHHSVFRNASRKSVGDGQTMYFVKEKRGTIVRSTLLSRAKIFDTAKEAKECKSFEGLLSEAHISPVTEKELFTVRLKGI